MTYIVYFIFLSLIIAGILVIRKEFEKRERDRMLRWRIRENTVEIIDVLKEKIFSRMNRDKLDMELYQSISYVRNMASIQADLSSQRILDHLFMQCDKLKPVYAEMIGNFQQNKREEAMLCFREKVKGDLAADFARLLIQWDELEPKVLIETLVSYQKNSREIRKTIRKRKDELISDLIYLPIVINIVVIFINFIYVAYFIDQRNMLNMMF